MVDADADKIDKISEPYCGFSHENKSVSKRFRKKFLNVYSHSTSPFIVLKDETRLRYAASHNDIERINELLHKGVNPNVPDENGRTALHLASCRGYSEVVEKLLSYNANCNAVDKLGNTPLHLAVCTTSKATVDLLLKAGCSISQKGNNGCTPLQLAQSKLWLMQRHKRPDYNSLKAELNEVIGMMKRLVEDKSKEAELVNAFSSRLNLTSSSDEVVDDVKQLLDSLSLLKINKSLSLSDANQLPVGNDTGNFNE